jgi:hypothetical protein
MPGRQYTAPLNITTGLPTPAQIDIFEILAGTGKPLRILSWELGQSSETGDAQEEQLTLILKRATGTVTSGSGGATPTFQAVNHGDAAAGATIETGNTTKLVVGTGTVVELARFAWNVRAPQPAIFIPEIRWTVDAGGRLVLELATTPADAITSGQGWVAIEEII